MFQKRFIYLLLFLFANVQIVAQDLNQEVVLNSKKQLRKHHLADSLKIHHYSNIIIYYTTTKINPDSIIFYGNEALTNFSGQENQRFIGGILTNMSAAYWYKSDYEKAIKIIEQKLNLFENQKVEEFISDYMNLGLFEIELGNYIKGMEHLFYAEKSILDLLEQKDTTLRARKSFENLSIIYNNLGLAFEHLGDPNRAIQFFEKSADYLFKAGKQTPKDLALIYANICVQQIETGALLKAKDNIEKALEASEKTNDEKIKGLVKYNYAAWHETQGNFKKAEFFYLNAIEHYKFQGNQNELGKCYRDVGQLYTEMNQFKDANNYLSRAEEKFSTSESKKDMVELHLAFSKLYEKEGDIEKSYDYLKMYQTEYDEIINDEVKKQGIRMDFTRKYEKQILKDSLENAKQIALNNEQLKRKDIALKTKKNQQMILGVGLLISAVLLSLVFHRYRQNLKQKKVIETQHLKLSSKNKEITDSIQYAKRIQTAILPPQSLVKSYLNNSLILYKPKAVVAGDFYWMEQVGDHLLFAAADCTGHGVPGAMVSVVCNNGLNRSVREFGLTDPDKILDKTREIVVQEFEKSKEGVKDGMDISLCSLSLTTLALSWAGANNPLWIIRKGAEHVEEIKADKQPIGQYDLPVPYTKHELKLHEGDSIYLFTDGYQDQFGGEKNKKFKPGNFKKLLLQIQEKTMEEQEQILHKSFLDWKRDVEQVDDVCVLGVRL